MADNKGVDPIYLALAGDYIGIIYQSNVFLIELRVKNKFRSENFLSSGVINFSVIFGNDMKDYIIECRINIMSVIVEIGRPDMNFDIPGPLDSGNLKTGIEKIRTGITVIFPGIDDNDLIAFVVKQFLWII